MNACVTSDLRPARAPWRRWAVVIALSFLPTALTSAQGVWTPTSTIGAPAARSYHAAVWTGSKMIVWGGYLKSVPLFTDPFTNTGGLYDPATDSWHAHEHDRRSDGAARRDRGVDGVGNDRVGRIRLAGCQPGYGRALRPGHGQLDADEHERRPHGAQRSHGRVDGLEDDRLGWAVRGHLARVPELRRDLRSGDGHLDGDEHRPARRPGVSATRRSGPGRG